MRPAYRRHADQGSTRAYGTSVGAILGWMTTASPSHSHADHQHGGGATQRRLALVLALTFTYMIAEAVGGWLTGSLALLADAGHMLSDVAALGLALFAIWVASRRSGPRWTYGRGRAEILAALAQGVALVAVALLIIFEARERLGQPQHVAGLGVMAIAAGGLGINLIALWLLQAGRRESLNVRGAWLHVMSDALGSVGAVASGALIFFFGWQWADPVASIAIAALVLASAWMLMRDAVDVLMEAAPRGLDPDEILASLCALGDVENVHDLHVWSLDGGQVALSCHIVVQRNESNTPLLSRIYQLLGERYGICHATVQFEPPDFSGENPQSLCGGGCENSLDTETAHAEGRHAH